VRVAVRECKRMPEPVLKTHRVRRDQAVAFAQARATPAALFSLAEQTRPTGRGKYFDTETCRHFRRRGAYCPIDDAGRQP